MNRKRFLEVTLAASIMAAVRPALAAGHRPRIILRSSWQTVNIGDIAHSPGVLTILEKHLPEAEIILWASDVGRGASEMLLRRFPNLKITTAGGNRNTLDRESEVHELFDSTDFFLHGSGPWLVAQRHVDQWIRMTGKPFGVYGISLPESRSDETIVSLLSEASFVFFRDSVSLELAKRKGVASPVMEFGPDGAFAFDIRDDEAAKEFLVSSRLQLGQFLCVIPRYRKTPYWEIPGRERPENEWLETHESNQRMAEQDLSPYREAITAVVRQTSMKILICPEDVTQIRLGKTFLFDRLPDDVRRRVVWRDRFWLPDEALSIYTQSAGLFGLEQHSPIMCIGNGIPAFVGRFAEQTSKGFMWKDIGLSEWLFDSDSAFDMEQLAPRVLDLAKHPNEYKQKAIAAKVVVERRQAQTMKVVRNILH